MPQRISCRATHRSTPASCDYETKWRRFVGSQRRAGCCQGAVHHVHGPRDTVEPNFVSTAVQAMGGDAGPDMVTFGLNINGGGAFASYCPDDCNSSEAVLRTYFPLVLGYTEAQFAEWLRTGQQGTHEQGWVWRCIFRNDIIRRHHLRFPAHISAGEDQMFLSSYLLHAQSVKHIPDLLYHYSVRPTGSYMENISGRRMGKTLQGKIHLLEERMRLTCLYREHVPCDARSLYGGSCLYSALQLGVLAARRLTDYAYFSTYVHIPEIRAIIDRVSLPKINRGIKRTLPVFLLKHKWYKLLFTLLLYVAQKLGVKPGMI